MGATGRGGIYHPTGCSYIITSVGPIVGAINIGHTYGYCWKTDLGGGLDVGPVGSVGMGMGHPRDHFHPSGNVHPT